MGGSSWYTAWGSGPRPRHRLEALRRVWSRLIYLRRWDRATFAGASAAAFVLATLLPAGRGRTAATSSSPASTC
ncbi:MAG: hypothetical protein WKH64_12690 [Chloroflexia bacterium]